jgi:hypothetical protein
VSPVCPRQNQRRTGRHAIEISKIRVFSNFRVINQVAVKSTTCRLP